MLVLLSLWSKFSWASGLERSLCCEWMPFPLWVIRIIVRELTSIKQHFSRSQAFNRRVTKAGMSTLYIQEESFASLVMSLVGLCYLPLAQLPAALEELEGWQFDDKMAPEAIEKATGFKSHLIQYTREYWFAGEFAPKHWNFWMHGRNNTNNR